MSAVLRQAIRQGVLKPGEDLVQEEIAGRLGVSRVPLREALRALAAVGLVQFTPGRGFRVTELEPVEVEELYDLRLRIEPSLAEKVVAHASRLQIEELAGLEQDMRAADDPEQWANLNYDFHLTMYQAAGADHTLRMVRQLLDLVEPYSRVYVHELRNLDRVTDEHDAMVAALREGDAERLGQMITDHLVGARDGLVAAMTAAQQADDAVSRLAGLSGSS